MTNDTPDLDAVIAELETTNDFQTCAVRAHKHWPQLLSAARIAQELTALLGVGDFEAVAELTGILRHRDTLQTEHAQQVEKLETLRELTALLGPEPVVKATALVEEREAIRRMLAEAAVLAVTQEAESARLRERVAELEEQATMACIEPREGCQCAGCAYARDAHAKTETP